MDKTIKSLKEALTNDINEKLDDIYNSLVEDTKKSIPESLFRGYFLPRLVNLEDNRDVVLEWISVAGSPSQEVYVFDDTTKEILFKVPPIISSFGIRNSKDIGNIMTRYSQISNNFPIKGEKYLEENLDIKVEEIKQDIEKDFNESSKSWENILKRYGFIEEDKSNQESSKPKDDVSNYLDI